MKTLTTLALVAAVGAFILSPLSLELTVAALSALGLGAIVVTDYRRVQRRIPLPALAGVSLSRKERFGLAA
jgi:hypothetical protein